ncbi:MAG: leucine-rich repeat domain-containing protein [Rubripirellula sp.]
MQTKRPTPVESCCPRRPWVVISDWWARSCANVLLAVVCGCVLVSNRPTEAADRTTLFFPLSYEATSTDLPPSALLPDAAYGDAASEGWKAYLRLWQAHGADPANASIRRFLGLPLQRAFEANARRGKTAPSWLRWRAGTFAQVDTPHFVIYSRADEKSSKLVAEDLERCYWAWTQMFFPLWEANAQVSGAFRDLKDDLSVSEYLKSRSQRITVRRKLRVVLFRDAEEYQSTLGAETPGIERSTGFYNDQRQTTFLYAAEEDDAATRRHEMVHQLFREATRSGLGRQMPGEESGFWLVEGIAGYFESLSLGSSVATVGGWDAPRLQFARYRVLVGGDMMPMRELQEDGRMAAQRRSDLARWYAHSILRTHQLMDAGAIDDRKSVYTQLAKLYRVKADDLESVSAVETSVLDQGVRSFLAIDDQHLQANRVNHPLSQLCLAGCEVTEQGISLLPASPQLRWLDLARLPVGNTEIQRLAPNSAALEQLTLEVTRIDQGLIPWLQKATNLREVDLSWTKSDDAVIEALNGAADLSTLWMTGSKLTDRSIDSISRMQRLESVDLQRTEVTEAGIGRLRTARPQLQINPLELRAP